MKKSKFVSLSQLASKATGGAYGSTPGLPANTAATDKAAANVHASSAGGVPSGQIHHAANGGGPPSGGAPNSLQPPQRRPTWADRVREKLPPLGENEYEVLWERGVLGVIFLESEKDGIPYVSKATESCISPMVAPGDVLKFVNVVRSKDHSFSDFFKILATMKKPVLLRFERAPSSKPPSPNAGEPLDHRSTSAGDMGTKVTRDTIGTSTQKVTRSNSLPQSETNEQPQQRQSVRGTFWRASSARDTAGGQQQARSSLVPPRKGDDYSPREQDRMTVGHARQSTKETDNDDQGEYYDFEVYWETGSLGLFFGEERGTGRPVVTRSAPGTNPAVDRMVAPNDILIAANNVRSGDYSFEAFFARLQQMNKPVKLVFRRKDNPPARPRKTSVTAEAAAAPQESRSNTQQRDDPRASASLRRTPSPPPLSGTPSPVASNGYPRQESPVESGRPKSPAPPRQSSPVVERDQEASRSSTVIPKPQRQSSTGRLDVSPREGIRRPPPSPTVADATIRSQPTLNSRESEHRSKHDVSERYSSVETSRQKWSKEPSPRHRMSEGATSKSKSGGIFVVEQDVSSPPASEPVKKSPEAAYGGSASDGADAVESVAVGDVVAPDAIVAEAVDEPVSGTKSDVVQTSSAKQSSTSGLDDGLDDDLDDEEIAILTRETAMLGDELGDDIIDELDHDDVDISADTDIDGNEAIPVAVKDASGNASTSNKPSKAALNANLARYRKKAKNSRPLVKLPALSEAQAQTVPLVAPNAVNTTVQVRGRSKPKPSLNDTPDSSTFLVKWKEGKSVGLQLREVRFAKGSYPLVVDVCKEPCCELLKHVCIGDIIVEVNGKNCSSMGVKKTVNFLKTSSKTMLLKFRHGPGFTIERVSGFM